MSGQQSFVGLIKAYTADCAFTIIGGKMRTVSFTPLIVYISTIMKGLNDHYMQYSYKECYKPVYRGFNAKFVNMDDY